MIEGIRNHLFSALRDIVFTEYKLADQQTFDLSSLRPGSRMPCSGSCATPTWCAATMPGLVVCWGGHSISRAEYDYSKTVGYSLGLRGFDICTGCGPGAMKGPMKGAAIAHAKQLQEATAATSACPSRASSPPSHPTPSSTSW
jgi:hypothetical protein